MGGRRPADPTVSDALDEETIYQRFVTVTGLPRDVSGREPLLPTSEVSRDQVRPAAGRGPVTPAGEASPPAADESAAVLGEPDPSSPRAKLFAVFSPGRRGIRAIALVAVAVALAAAFLVWRTRPQVRPVQLEARQAGDAPVASQLADARGATEAAPAVARSESTTLIVVAVTGKVRKPGLVRLPAGARVADAIEAAGGALADTDLAFVNVARRLIDGELVLVGVTPSVPVEQPAAAGGGLGASAGVVNLNLATLQELQTLPGVGPVLAQRILDFRVQHGGFRAVSELRQVEGIGSTRFDRLKDRVSV